MPSGIPNKEKAAVRQRYAEGKASREELLESEMKSYHSPGTCTFYGTANQSGGDGDHGPAPAGLLVRKSLHAAARALTREAARRSPA